jgi:hypothetical protein
MRMKDPLTEDLKVIRRVRAQRLKELLRHLDAARVESDRRLFASERDVFDRSSGELPPASTFS